jgi:hypothetical protein
MGMLVQALVLLLVLVLVLVLALALAQTSAQVHAHSLALRCFRSPYSNRLLCLQIRTRLCIAGPSQRRYAWRTVPA